MKRFILFCSALLLSCVLLTSCQDQTHFKLKGSIAGFVGKSLILSYYDLNSGIRKDTIQVKDGNFSFETELSAPASALLQGDNFSKAIAIAPGYDLTITANASNKTVTYAGKGDGANNFYTAIDTLDISAFFPAELSKEAFVDSLKKAKIVQDARNSIFAVKEQDKKDKHYMFFANLASYDLTFKRFKYTIQYLDQHFADFKAAEADSLLKQNFDQTLVADLSDESNLNSPAFRDAVVNDPHYVFYRAKASLQKEPAETADKDYFLKIIDQSFKGKVRAYVTESFLKNDLFAKGRATGG